MKRAGIAACLLIIVCLSFVPMPVYGETAGEESVKILTGLRDLYRTKDLTQDQKFELAKAIARERVDFLLLTATILGSQYYSAYWVRRQEFADVFREFFESSMLKRIASIETVEAVTLASESVNGERAEVRLRITAYNPRSNERDNTSITLWMVKRGEQWKVYNARLDFFNIAQWYYAQVDKILRDNDLNFDAVLDKYRNKQR